MLPPGSSIRGRLGGLGLLLQQARSRQPSEHIIETRFTFKCEFRLTGQPCLEATSIYMHPHRNLKFMSNRILASYSASWMFWTKVVSKSFSPAGRLQCDREVSVRRKLQAKDEGQSPTGGPVPKGPIRSVPSAVTDCIFRPCILITIIEYALIAIGYGLALLYSSRHDQHPPPLSL
jgi:hypothetical protein